MAERRITFPDVEFAAQQSAPGFWKSIATETARPFVSMHRAPALFGDESELGATLQQELIRQSTTPEPTLLGRAGGFAGSILGGVGQIIGSSLLGARAGGRPGAAAMAGLTSGSSAAWDTFINAGTRALAEGRSPEEAVAIGKQAALLGGGITAAATAALPGVGYQIVGPTGRRLAAEAALGAGIGAGQQTLSNVAMQKLGLSVPTGEGVGEAAGTMAVIPPLAAGVLRMLGIRGGYAPKLGIEPAQYGPTIWQRDPNVLSRQAINVPPPAFTGGAIPRPPIRQAPGMAPPPIPTQPPGRMAMFRRALPAPPGPPRVFNLGAPFNPPDRPGPIGEVIPPLPPGPAFPGSWGAKPLGHVSPEPPMQGPSPFGPGQQPAPGWHGSVEGMVPSFPAPARSWDVEFQFEGVPVRAPGAHPQSFQQQPVPEPVQGLNVTKTPSRTTPAPGMVPSSMDVDPNAYWDNYWRLRREGRLTPDPLHTYRRLGQRDVAEERYGGLSRYRNVRTNIITREAAERAASDVIAGRINQKDAFKQMMAMGDEVAAFFNKRLQEKRKAIKDAGTVRKDQGQVPQEGTPAPQGEGVGGADVRKAEGEPGGEAPGKTPEAEVKPVQPEVMPTPAAPTATGVKPLMGVADLRRFTDWLVKEHANASEVAKWLKNIEANPESVPWNMDDVRYAANEATSILKTKAATAPKPTTQPTQPKGGVTSGEKVQGKEAVKPTAGVEKAPVSPPEAPEPPPSAETYTPRTQDGRPITAQKADTGDDVSIGDVVEATYPRSQYASADDPDVEMVTGKVTIKGFFHAPLAASKFTIEAIPEGGRYPRNFTPSQLGLLMGIGEAPDVVPAPKKPKPAAPAATALAPTPEPAPAPAAPKPTTPAPKPEPTTIKLEKMTDPMSYKYGDTISIAGITDGIVVETGAKKLVVERRDGTRVTITAKEVVPPAKPKPVVAAPRLSKQAQAKAAAKPAAPEPGTTGVRKQKAPAQKKTETVETTVAASEPERQLYTTLDLTKFSNSKLLSILENALGRKVSAYAVRDRSGVGKKWNAVVDAGSKGMAGGTFPGEKSDAIRNVLITMFHKAGLIKPDGPVIAPVEKPLQPEPQAPKPTPAPAPAVKKEPGSHSMMYDSSGNPIIKSYDSKGTLVNIETFRSENDAIAKLDQYKSAGDAVTRSKRPATTRQAAPETRGVSRRRTKEPEAAPQSSLRSKLNQMLEKAVTTVRSKVAGKGKLRPEKPEAGITSVNPRALAMRELTADEKKQLDNLDLQKHHRWFITYEAWRKMPRESGDRQRLSEADVLNEEAEYIGNVKDRPYLWNRFEDPDDENTYVWAFTRVGDKADDWNPNESIETPWGPKSFQDAYNQALSYENRTRESTPAGPRRYMLGEGEPHPNVGKYTKEEVQQKLQEAGLEGERGLMDSESRVPQVKGNTSILGSGEVYQEMHWYRPRYGIHKTRLTPSKLRSIINTGLEAKPAPGGQPPLLFMHPSAESAGLVKRPLYDGSETIVPARFASADSGALAFLVENPGDFSYARGGSPGSITSIKGNQRAWIIDPAFYGGKPIPKKLQAVLDEYGIKPIMPEMVKGDGVTLLYPKEYFKGNAQEAPTVDPQRMIAEGPAPAAKVDAEMVQSIVDGFKARWKNAPDVELLDDPEFRDENGRPIKGDWQNGKVRLNLARIKDEADALATYLHEVKGHHSLEMVFGKEFGALLDNLGSRLTAADELRDLRIISERYGYDLSDQMGKRNAVAEYLARQASDHPWWKRLWYWVSDNVRRLFGVHSNEADIRNIFRRGEQFLKGKATGELATTQRRASIEALDVKTRENLDRLTKNLSNLDPAERIRVWGLVHSQVQPVSEIFRASYDALPDNVKAHLKDTVEGRYEVGDVARAELGPAAIPSNRLADHMTGTPDRDGYTAYSAIHGIIDLINKRDDLLYQERRLEADLAKTIPGIRTRKSIEDRIDESLLNAGRGIAGDYVSQQMAALRAATTPDVRAAIQNKIDNAENLATGFAMHRAIDDISSSLTPADMARGRPAVVDAARALLAGEVAAKPGKPGIAANIANQLLDIISNSPDVVRHVSAVRSEKAWRGAASPVDTDPALVAIRQARQFLEQQFQDPTFKENYKLAVKTTGFGSAEEFAASANKPFDPLVFTDPVSGKVYRVKRGFTAKDEAEAKSMVKTIMGLMEAYIDDPTGDPAKQFAFSRELPRLKEWYMNPSFDPELGKFLPTKANPAALLAKGHVMPGVLSTPEYLLSLIGGRDASEAMRQLQAFAWGTQMTDARWKDIINKLNNISSKAIAARNMTPVEYREKISDPILATYASPVGMKKAKVGSRLPGGYEVTDLDWQAVMTQKEFSDLLNNSVLNLSKITSIGRGLQPMITEKLGSKAFVRQAIPQEMIMPRRFTPDKVNDDPSSYTRMWQEARRSYSGDEAAFEAYVDRMFADGKPFADTFLSHIDTMVTNPIYETKSSPLLNQYRIVSDQYRTNNPPRSLAEVVDIIFNNGAVDADGNRMAKPEIKRQLISEVSTMFNRVFEWRENNRLWYTNPKTVEILSPDNHFTSPRGNQIAPDSFYTYSVLDIDAQSMQLAEAKKVYLHTLRNSLVSLRDNMNAERTKLMSRVDEAMNGFRTSMDALTAQKRAVTKVEQETHAELMAGQRMVELGELDGHIRNVSQMIADIDKYARGDMSMSPEMQSGSSLFRTLVGAPLLNAFPVVTRNVFGGTAQLAKVDQAITALQQIAPAWPIFGIPKSMLMSARFMGEGLVKMVEGWAGAKFAKSEYGQSVLRSLRSHPEFWNTWTGGMLMHMLEAADQFRTMRELGINSVGPWGERMKALWNLQSGGGFVRAEQPTARQRKLERLRALAELSTETGITGLAPRSSFQMFADMWVNAGAVAQADWLARRLEHMAHKYLVKTGAINSIKDYDALPHSVITGPLTTPGQAVWLRREIMDKAGINLDQAMIRYARAISEALRAGRDTSDIRLFDDAEVHGLWQVMAAETNKPTYGNRPFLVSQTPDGRLLGMFQGYGVWDNTQYAKKWAKFSQDNDPANIRGHTRVAAMLLTSIATMMAGAIPIIKALQPIFYKKDYPVPDPLKAAQEGDYWDAVKAMLINGSPAFPLIGTLATQMIEQMRPGTGLVNFGMSLLPISVFNQTVRAIRDTISTGNAARPALNYIKQFMPNTQILINRLPYMEGAVERSSLRRQLQVATPSSIELRSLGSSGAYRLSPISDNIASIANALYKPGGPDMSEALRQRQIAIEYKINNEQKTEEQAAREVDSAVMSKTPWMDTYGRNLTPEERQQVELRAAEGIPSRVADVERAFSEYAATVGRAEPRFTLDAAAPTGGGGDVARLRPHRLGLMTPTVGLTAPSTGAYGGGTGGYGSVVRRGGRRVGGVSVFRIRRPTIGRAMAMRPVYGRSRLRRFGARIRPRRFSVRRLSRLRPPRL